MTELFCRLSVLLVDDSSPMRVLIRALLLSFGVNDVLEANDGSEALDLLRSQPRDLVISDLSMKPMDGLEFARRLRQPGELGNPCMPILMISSHNDFENVKQALDAGVTEYLIKPLTAGGLRQRIKSIVERPKTLVTSDNYSGPDRRRSRIGQNKRRRKADFTQQPDWLLK